MYTIINKTGKEIIKQMWRERGTIGKERFAENSFSLCELLARTFLTKPIHNRCKSILLMSVCSLL